MCFLVTGSCGTIGAALVNYLLAANAECNVIGLDNNESGLFFQEQQFIAEKRVSFHLADIRDRTRLGELMRGVDIVFHAAAYKHVVMCERAPMDAVQTNILGVNNIIATARQNKVKKVIFTSTDKAVNPTNVMGTSKLMSERLITAANTKQDSDEPIFSSTRFGNVLGSSGSVIPIFRKQIAAGGPVTLTDPNMTRFVMTVDEAVRLVVESTELARGGEVFVTKMPVIRISDLAQAMIEEIAPIWGHEPKDIEIRVIGTKPGEKLYEELMSEEETRRTVELPRYFAVLPAFRDIYSQIVWDYPNQSNKPVTNPYISSNEKPLDMESLKQILKANNLLNSDNCGEA